MKKSEGARIVEALDAALAEAGMLDAEGWVEVELDRKIAGCDWWYAKVEAGKVVDYKRADQ